MSEVVSMQENTIDTRAMRPEMVNEECHKPAGGSFLGAAQEEEGLGNGTAILFCSVRGKWLPKGAEKDGS